MSVHLDDLRTALRPGFSHFERAQRAMHALAWDDGAAARVEWSNGVGVFGRVSLRGYPTSASIFVPPDEDRHSDWEAAWLDGRRWCLVLRDGSASWYDLQFGDSWSSTLTSQDADAFLGFTPGEFLRLGRFEPRVPSTSIKKADIQPATTGILLKHMMEWWNAFLADYGSPQNQDKAKRLFAETIASVLLIRTVEDLRVSPFLPQGRLGECVDALTHGRRKDLQDLFGQLADKFASRVLRGLSERYYPDGPFARMVSDTYAMGLDFARLDVDPVGQFYEEVLGASYERDVEPQTDLFVRTTSISRDPSARRTGGVYYTPRAYADTLARKLVRPAVRVAEDLNELPVVVDVAVGSGELLCAALREFLRVPTWQHPEKIKVIMERKLYGLDINKTSAPLTALNLLRTAVRRVPELVTDHLPLPSLEKNLVIGNALNKRVLSKLPMADVCLVNPPFHGKRMWQNHLPKSQQIPALRNMAGTPNMAFAVLLAALSHTRTNGYFGAVFPSNLMSGAQASTWRDLVTEQVDIHCVVENYANAFEGVQSYAGLIWGRCRAAEAERRSQTRVVRINGAMKFDAVDFGAILANGGAGGQLVRDTLSPPIDGESWIAKPKPSLLGVDAQGTSTVAQLLEGREVHQAPVMAPKPWGRKLFLFRASDDEPNRLRHELSPFTVRAKSAAFRSVAWPNYMSTVPLLCEPMVPDIFVLLPGDGRSPVSLSDLEAVDSVAAEAGRAIRMVVQSRGNRRVPASGRAFVESLRTESLAWHTPKGYVSSSEPLVVAARATRSNAGIRSGVGWSAWVNLDGSIVPVGGLWFRSPNADVALLLATWMTLPIFAERMASLSPQRNLGTSEPQLRDLMRVRVPTLRSSPLLRDFLTAIGDYRRLVKELDLDTNSALELEEWMVARSLALRLLTEDI